MTNYIIYIYIKQVKQESYLTPSKDDRKMRWILEALQVQIYKSKKEAKTTKIFFH